MASSWARADSDKLTANLVEAVAVGAAAAGHPGPAMADMALVLPNLHWLAAAAEAMDMAAYCTMSCRAENQIVPTLRHITAWEV